MSGKSHNELAEKYKAKCIKLILANNITVAPKGMDPKIFEALLKISSNMKTSGNK